MQLFKNVRVSILTFCFKVIRDFTDKINRNLHINLFIRSKCKKYCLKITKTYTKNIAIISTPIDQTADSSVIRQYQYLQSNCIQSKSKLIHDCRSIQQVTGGSGGHQHDEPRGDRFCHETKLLQNNQYLRQINGGSGGHQHDEPRGDRFCHETKLIQNNQYLRQISGGSGGHQHEDQRG
ncbi:hypothetical protein HUZ36_10335 [Pseudoalteromonas sp. McH1-7]|uniref:hypothetical protein n=1 Tax=Pseudoalteromonas sp. McH1-7 TaxID=2745574 RepID=UPI0015914799|nr:hypothetical protein [Pseudoalteromonas sp. McH1-7]NUZ11178.1 hypothetical protein [Pseudoalteromonas sp. McH1-7]